MLITRLLLQNFRNHPQTDITFSPQINLITGSNGSGKTSILESLYILARGRSFRTSLLDRIIHYSKNEFRIIAELQDENDQLVSVEYEKAQKRSSRIRIAANNSATLSELVRLVPAQLLNINSYQLLTQTPEARRKLLDWGMFHVKHQYGTCWKTCFHVLRQRNSSLKQILDSNQIKCWDVEFSRLSHVLDNYRQQYTDELIIKIQSLIKDITWINKQDLSFEYYRGWPEDRALIDVLQSQFKRDIQLKYTQFGPQRADFNVKINHMPAGHVLSLGQQKSLVAIIQIAQLMLFQEKMQQQGILLIDDLSTELDETVSTFLFSMILKLKCQIFITAIDPTHWLRQLGDQQAFKMFHVEHLMSGIPAHGVNCEEQI